MIEAIYFSLAISDDDDDKQPEIAVDKAFKGLIAAVKQDNRMSLPAKERCVRSFGKIKEELDRYASG